MLVAVYLAAAVSSLLLTVNGDTSACVSPKVNSQTYSTLEAYSSTSTQFIVVFGLECKNGATNVNLHAEVGDRYIPVTHSVNGERYQVSWGAEHKAAPSGRYPVRFFDEEGYSVLRKAQRSGDAAAAAAVKPLFTVDVDHPGIWKGAYVSSELIALVVSSLVFYYAYTVKSKIME